MPVPAPEQDDLETVIATVARQLAEEARSTVSEHPSTEELVAYQEHRLEETDRDRLRRHLVGCEECARRVLELEDFDLPPSPDLLPTREQTAASWDAFQQRLANERRAPAPEPWHLSPVPLRRSRPPGFLSPRSGALLAASLMLFIGALGFWLAGAQRWSGAAGTNPFVFALSPDGEELRREESRHVEIVVPAGMDLLVPRLRLGNQDAYATYRAELLDASGRSIEQRRGFQRQPDGSFALSFTRSELPAGDYRLEVLGLSEEASERLATYSFRLRYSSDE